MPPTSRTNRPGSPGSSRRGWFALVALVAVVAAVCAVVLLSQPSVAPLEEDPCERRSLPTAALLVDLRKPIRHSAPRSVLRDVARRLETGTRLRVYAVTTDRLAPRRFVGGLCRSFDHDELAVPTAKDSSAEVRDCVDLPAQIAPRLREAAVDYCARRAALVEQIDALSRPSGVDDVLNAYLMEALEDTMRELAAGPAPSTLYVFSDMLQHAHWYSHLDLEWTAWRFEDFESVRDAHDRAFHTNRPTGLAVRVLYVPRLGLTDARRAKAAHWAFWRRYFDGVDTKFEERATMPGFVAATLMDVAGDVSAVARQREALAAWRTNSEVLVRRIEAEQEAIAERERAAVAAVGGLEAGLAELQRTRLALRAERQELQAGLDAWQESEANDRAALVSAPPPVEPSPPVICRLTLQPTFEADLAVERQVGGRRTDYGAATVAIRYAVSAEGRVVDDTVAIEPARSTATLAEHMDVLAADAVAAVRDWRFGLECDGDIANDSRHWGTATLSYRRKCIGAPIPQCWTVRTEAAWSSGDGEPNT